MSASKKTGKALTRQKINRRKWLTFLRMCRYGVNNFSRNAWLTIAATAVMTITLIIIFVAVATHTILSDTVSSLRDKISMSIYLKTDTTTDQINSVINDLQTLKSVRGVTVESSSDARKAFVLQNKNNVDVLATINEATNKFPNTLHIAIQDINNTSELASFVANNTNVKKYLDTRPPSFAGDSKAAIESIGQAGDFAQKAGIIASAIFVAISTLIIFNTIRMAIFNRKEEIQMMKLIGADQSFIRGPFVVEAIVYGFIAALIATGLGFLLLYGLNKTGLSNYLTIQPTLDAVVLYAGFVIVGMILIGAFIGIVSSLLATRRYLKL
jgi:cell division transport system permease protein